jgi:predicted RNA-binding Zn ribbon-like protein
MRKERSLKTLSLDGGTLPFHFINTVYAWKGRNLHEYLNNYRELLEWCRKVKILPGKILAGLEDYSVQYPQKTEDAFARIKEVRYLLYQFFSGVAGNGTAIPVLNSYNAVLQQALARYAWIRKKNSFYFTPVEDVTELLSPLYIVLKQSHDLLINEDTLRMKECPRCGWIFLDNTKNNKRRWCNPSTCGSVEKTQKYYQKIKKTKKLTVSA